MIDSQINSNYHGQVLISSNFATQTPDLSQTPYSPSDSNSPSLPHTSLSPEGEGDNELIIAKSNVGRPAKQYPSHYFTCDPDQRALLDKVFETFSYIETNIYLTPPRSKKEDLFICSCKYQKGISSLEDACGRPDCPNRCLYIECDKNCPTGKYCQNRRFQNRQFAKVNLIQTLKKGHGLSAAEHVKKDEFIMEYIGEVITTDEFQDRSVSYSEAGYEHFYFMQSQNGEIIDATKKGCLSRFVNHSCNPNCILQKWQIGNRHRIGLFTLRDVQPGEELTFDYRSTRFGEKDQVCYCGEDSCRGFISSTEKSVTKSVHIFDPEDPLVPFYDEDEVAEHVKLMRQCNDDPELALLYLGKLNHPNSEKLIGASIKCQVFIDLNQWLHTYENDPEVVKCSLEALIKLPFQYRNKIEQYNIDDTVKKFLTHPDSEIAELASATLEKWSTLKSVYRIPLIKNTTIPQMIDDSPQIQPTQSFDNSNGYNMQYPMYSSVDYSSTMTTPYNPNSFRRKLPYPRYPTSEPGSHNLSQNSRFPYPQPYNPNIRINTTNSSYPRYKSSTTEAPKFSNQPPSKSVSLSSSPSQVSKISNDSPAPSSVLVRVPIPPAREYAPTYSFDSIKLQWDGLPKPYSAFMSPDRQVFFYNNITKKAQWTAPEDSIPRIEGQSQAAIDSVVEMAKQFAEKTRVDSGQVSPVDSSANDPLSSLSVNNDSPLIDSENPPKRPASSLSTMANKELVSKLRAQLCDVVRKAFSLYQSRMDREIFKKHCRKIVHILLSKEQKTREFRKGRLIPNDAAFREKVQKFVDSYAAKLLVLLGTKQASV